MAMPASRPISACHSSGLPYIRALVRSWFFDGPPSIR